MNLITTDNVFAISTALESAFGQEFSDLEPKHMWAVAHDFNDAHNNEGISASEYKSRIWAGNLESYAKTLLA